VYSYAIIIWELLTRRVPWEGLNREQIEANVRNGIRVRTDKNKKCEKMNTKAKNEKTK